MKNHKSFLIIAVLMGLLFANAGFSQPGMGRRGGGWQYWKMYDVSKVETVNGVVLSVDRITMAKGMPDGIGVTLKTEKGNMPIHLGPAWYIENQEEMIFEEDQIEVIGSRIDYQGKPALLAATVTKDDKMLTLRDEKGLPMWSGWRQGQSRGKMANRQNRPCGDTALDFSKAEVFSGKVIEVQKVDAKMGNWKGIHLIVKNQSEEIAVHLGPEWYMAKINAIFTVGDGVEIKGVRTTYQGEAAVFAAQINRGADSWILRDELGLPAWRGWRQGRVQ